MCMCVIWRGEHGVFTSCECTQEREREKKKEMYRDRGPKREIGQKDRGIER